MPKPITRPLRADRLPEGGPVPGCRARYFDTLSTATSTTSWPFHRLGCEHREEVNDEHTTIRLLRVRTPDR